MSVSKICGNCRGSGETICSLCDGRGHIGNNARVQEACPACNGFGVGRCDDCSEENAFLFLVVTFEG